MRTYGWGRYEKVRAQHTAARQILRAQLPREGLDMHANDTVRQLECLKDILPRHSLDLFD